VVATVAAQEAWPQMQMQMQLGDDNDKRNDNGFITCGHIIQIRVGQSGGEWEVGSGQWGWGRQFGAWPECRLANF